MTRKQEEVAVWTVSSIVGWMGRAALYCAGLVAMLALLIVFATLITAMLIATATPASVAQAVRDPRKRLAGSGYDVSGTRQFVRLTLSRFIGALGHTY